MSAGLQVSTDGTTIISNVCAEIPMRYMQLFMYSVVGEKLNKPYLVTPPKAWQGCCTLYSMALSHPHE